MADIAKIGFAADTSGLTDATAALKAMIPPAEKAEKAAADTGVALTKAGAAGRAAAAGLGTAETAMEQAAMGAREVTEASNAAAGALNRVSGASAKAGVAASGVGVAGTRAAAGIVGTTAALAGAGKSMKLRTDEMLNLSRQASDIGVTLAMGMNPLMVAIQQGPQIADIFQSASARGIGFTAVIKQIGSALWGLILPILPYLIIFAAAAIAIGSAFAIADHEISKSTGNIAAGMDLTKAQMQRLKDKATETSVTMGDTFKAFFVTIGQEFTEGFSGPLKSVGEFFDSVYAHIRDGGIATIKAIVGTFVGGYAAIVATWDQLPAVLGDVFIQGVNLGIDALNGFLRNIGGWLDSIEQFYASLPDMIERYFILGVNKAKDALTWLNNKIEQGVQFLRDNWKQIPLIIAGAFYEGANKAIAAISWLVNKVVEGINWLGGHLKNADFGHIDNPFSGAASKAMKDGVKAFTEGYKQGGDAVDRFGAKWTANAKKIAEARILKAAGHPGAEAKTPKGPKSDAEKFDDIVTGANAYTDKKNAETAALGLGAEAAAKLTHQTDLLNQVTKAGIPLTDERRAKIDELSSAMAKADAAFEHAKFMQGIKDAADNSIFSLKMQADTIGLVGQALIYQTTLNGYLADAQAKKITLDQQELALLKEKAGIIASQSAANDNIKYIKDATAASNENIDTLTAELAAMGKSDAAVAAAAYHQKLLNDEKYRGIVLTPQEIADLETTATKQYQLQVQIDATRGALDFAKDAAKGFISDLQSGLQKGEGFFKTFVNAVLGVLTKLVNKLAEVSLDSLMGGSGGGAGGFLSGLGKLFGGGSGGGGFLSSLFGSGATASSGGALSTILGGGSFFTGGAALGATFDHGRRFAKGGTFTNSIIDHPTMFSYAKGAAMGEMGEAGPEAIVPLKRGPDGSLGVQMHGAQDNSGTVINAPVQVDNHYTISGALSSADIVALTKKSAEETIKVVKRSVVPWLDQHQRDGALS